MSRNSERGLAGRVAVITGGAQGIGLGIAARLAEEGADVVLADIKIDAAEASARTHQRRRAAEHPRSRSISAMMHRWRACRQGRRGATAAAKFSINNAAIGADTSSIREDDAWSDYHDVIRINQDGAVRMTHGLLAAPQEEPGQAGAFSTSPRSRACAAGPTDRLCDRQGRHRQLHPRLGLSNSRLMTSWSMHWRPVSSIRPCRSCPMARMNMMPTGFATSMSDTAAYPCAASAVRPTWRARLTSSVRTMRNM